MLDILLIVNYNILQIVKRKEIKMKQLTIKELRKKKKLTRKELAKLSKISEAYLSMLENNKRTPTIAVINDLANALECKPENIFLSFNSTKS